MSIDLSPRFAAGFPPIQPAAPAKTSSEAFDPFAVVRSGAVPESNRFVQALEHLYGIAEGSLTAAAAQTATQAAPLAPAAPVGSGLTSAQAGAVQVDSTELKATMVKAPGSPEVSTLSALMRRAAEQNAAGVTRQSAADALLGPWAGVTDKTA